MLQQLFNRETPISNFESTLVEIDQSNIYSQAYILFSQQNKLKNAPTIFQQALQKKYQVDTLSKYFY